MLFGTAEEVDQAEYSAASAGKDTAGAAEAVEGAQRWQEDSDEQSAACGQVAMEAWANGKNTAGMLAVRRPGAHGLESEAAAGSRGSWVSRLA